MKKLSDSLQSTWYDYHKTQVSPCVETFGIFLESTLPKFHNSRAVLRMRGSTMSAHMNRMHGKVFWLLRHSVEELHQAI
jgi:hypothetical protein